MRLFAAIAFDEATKRKLAGYYSELRAAGITGNFTSENNIHLTLKFIGEVDNSQLIRVTDAVQKAASTVSHFDISSTVIGYFSSRGEKTVWLGMEGQHLDAAAKSVDMCLYAKGFEPEKRKFTPHVTIVRRADCSYEALQKLPPINLSFPVNAITLFESQRVDGILRYKPLSTAYLK